jgi:hypothetical protein
MTKDKERSWGEKIEAKRNRLILDITNMDLNDSKKKEYRIK